MSDLLNSRTSVFCRVLVGLLPQRQQTFFGARCLIFGKHPISSTVFLYLIIPLLYFNVANAGNLSLLVNGKSFHLNPPNDIKYNENNWGAGVQYDIESYSKKWVPFLTASGFIDSFDNPSYYTGAGLVRRIHFNHKKDGKHFDAGIMGFLMTREDFKDGSPFFGMLPALSFGTRRYAVNMTYIPKVDPKMVALWFFQFKISTDNF